MQNALRQTFTALTLAVGFIFMPAWVGADATLSQPAHGMTLAQVLEMAKAHNPDILAAQKEWEMADAKILSTKTWPDPQVGVEYWGFARSSLNVGSAPEKWYDVSQTVPFPGKLTLRGRAAAHEARRQKELYQATEREVLAQVKEAYYGLFYAEHATQAFKENVGVMQRFARIAESKYSVGKSLQADALRAQVELTKMQNMALTTDDERETAKARLNALLDRSPEEPISAQEEPSMVALNYSFADLERTALENRPEVMAAHHHVTHMQAELAAARADYLPDTMVQYTWRTRDGEPNDAVAMFKLNLPVWFWRQRSIIKSAAFEKEHADAMYRSAQTMTRYEVKEFLTHVQTSRRLVELYKTTVLPQSEQSLKVTEAAYQSDRTGFLELLDSERALIEFWLEYYKALADYGSNLAHLERLVGTEFLASGKIEGPQHSHE